MATATGTYIAVDELRATLGSTTANYVSELRATGNTTTAQLVRRMWMNDSSNILTMVWDVWNTMLTATIEDMPSEGGYVEDYLSVSSYGTDVNGGSHDMGYSISPEYIAPNTSGSVTTKAVTVTQDGSGESVQLTAYIAGRVAVGTTYRTPTVTSTSISTVPASGNVTRYLTVYWTQVKVITYDNGTTSTSTVTGNSTATVTNGSSGTSVGAYISGGGVYVPSAGTTYYTSQRTAYTISQFSFTANGISSGTVSRTVYVYQSANTRTSTTEYSVYCGVASPSTIANTGGTFSFTASCQSRQKHTYASGSTENGAWGNAGASVSYSNGVSSVSHTSFTGSATITATVGENTSSSRNPRVTVTATNDTSVSDYTQVTQSDVSYTFTLDTKPSGNISYNAESFMLTITSKRNGTKLPFYAGDVTVRIAGVLQNSSSVVTVNEVASSNGKYNVGITIGKGGSTSKSISVTVVQPGSGQSVRYDGTQDPVSSQYPIQMVWEDDYGRKIQSNGWYLGQVPTGVISGGNAMCNIVAVTTASNSLDYEIFADFSYYRNPSGGTQTMGTYVQRKVYSRGDTITINGTVYYGLILVQNQPNVTQGTVNSFVAE